MNNKISWKFIMVAILILCGLSCLGQETAITATVTDSDGQTWNNAQWRVTFVTASSYPNINNYTINGTKIIDNPTYRALLNQKGTLNGSGQLSLNLLDNTQISPSGSQWAFTIQSNTSATATQYPNIAVSGASQNLTSFLSTNSIVPRFPASPISFGYLDGEITPVPPPGGYYFNVTLGYSRQWNGTIWQNFTSSTWNGGAVINPITSGVTLPSGAPSNTIGAVAEYFLSVPLDPRAFGAKLDVRFSNPGIGQAGCGTTSTSPNVTCTDLNFTSADIGKTFTVEIAGAAGVPWVTTVLSVTDSTHAVMNSNAPSSVTAGTYGSRAAIGTDDTAAWTAIFTACISSNGCYVYFPEGNTFIQGPLTLPSGLRLMGTGARTLASAGSPADFPSFPNGGSWFDCLGASSCFNGNNLNSVSLEYIGMTDALKAWTVGTSSTYGFYNSHAKAIEFVGQAGASAANFSTTAYEFVGNTEGFYGDDMKSHFVNSGIHLEMTSAILNDAANNTFKDFYTYSNPHTSANGNCSTYSIWITNYTTASMGGSIFIGQTQVNGYGDTCGAHMYIESPGTGSISGCSFYGLDLEGGTNTYGVQNTAASTSTFQESGIQGATGYLESGSAGNNRIFGNGMSVSGWSNTDTLFGYFDQSAGISGPYGHYVAGGNNNANTAVVEELYINGARFAGANVLTVGQTGGNNNGFFQVLGTGAATSGFSHRFGGLFTGATTVHSDFDQYGQFSQQGNFGQQVVGMGAGGQQWFYQPYSLNGWNFASSCTTYGCTYGGGFRLFSAGIGSMDSLVPNDGKLLIRLLGTAYPNSYSVAGTPLPTCNSVSISERLEVSDATLATPGSTYVGSGTYTIGVECIFNSTGSVYTWIID